MCQQPECRGFLLNVTDACNLRCPYCFVEQHPHYMPLQVAKDAADLLLKINKPKGVTPSITFFGGEPTLLFGELIIPLISYIEGKKEKITWNITTNCTLLTKDRIEYLKEHDVTPLCSIDGDKITQDFNRPTHDGESSFDIVEPQLELIASTFPNTTFRSTLIPKTCGYLFHNMMFALEKGFRSYYACPDDFSEWREEDVDKMFDQLRLYTLYFIDAFRNNQYPLIFSPIEDKFRVIIQHNKNIANETTDKKSRTRCGLGTTFASVNYEGKIFACQELPSYGDKDNLFYIGDIYNGIDVDRHQKLLDSYLNHKVECEDKSLCKNCGLYNTCQNSYCHANSYLKFGNTWTISKIRCLWEQRLLKEAIFIMNVLGNNENELFANYFLDVVKK